MKPLSQAQLSMLRELAKSDEEQRYSRWGWGSSCTNPTGTALQKRGFAKIEFDRSKGIVGLPWSRWLITDEGRKYLEELRP